MQDRLGSEMMQLDSPELQKSIEEFRHRKCKTTFQEITKHNGFKGTFHRLVERLATASSSTLDLSFLGAISMSRVQARGLREGIWMAQAVGNCESKFDGGQGLKGLKP